MSDPTPAASPQAAATLTVAELSAAIGRRLAEAFPAEVWVRGEIRDLRRSNRGTVWFALVDVPDDGSTTNAASARIDVVLPDENRQRVNRLLLRAGGAVRMTDGVQVRIRGRVDWYAPRGVLQLRMTSIDPAFTLGQLAAERAELLAKLSAEGLLAANRARPMPMAPLRIALVTSTGSAAEADVLDQLLASGFAFSITVHDVRVQGPDAALLVARAIRRCTAASTDVVLVVRGGGATTDLAAFDAEVVARAIAAASVPVVTGIGHEIDRTVADEVAHLAAKTPTAAAQVLIERVADAWARAAGAFSAIEQRARDALERAEVRVEVAADRAARAATNASAHELARLHHARERLVRAAARSLAVSGAGLDRRATVVEAAARRRIDTAQVRLDAMAARVGALDPQRALARGWTITRRADGRLVRGPGDVAAGDELTTLTAGGAVRSRVER